MKEVLKFIKELPWWFKNAYFLVGFSFLIWMMFFDRNNLVTNYDTNKKLDALIEQKVYYKTEIEKVNNLKDELFSTYEKKETFAREKYLMKKDNEDIFIIVEN